jgi:hypothetical protein
VNKNRRHRVTGNISTRPDCQFHPVLKTVMSKQSSHWCLWLRFLEFIRAAFASETMWSATQASL